MRPKVLMRLRTALPPSLSGPRVLDLLLHMAKAWLDLMYVALQVWFAIVLLQFMHMITIVPSRFTR